MNLKTCLLAVVLSGCAYVPISERPIPQAELEQCQAIAAQHSFVPNTVVGAVTGAAIGSLATGAARETTISGSTRLFGSSLPTTSRIAITNFTLPLAIVGAAIGALRVYDRRNAIVRECLRDHGYQTY